MLVENKRAIQRFTKQHATSRIPMAEWIQKVEAADWTSFADVRQTFNTADYVRPFVVFNVGGNNYRVLAEIIYISKTVRIARVGTHSEYSRWSL